MSLSKGIGIIFVSRGFFIGWNYCLCEQSTCVNERIFLQIKSVETITSNTPELRKLTSNTKPDSQRYWKQKHKVSVNIDIYICIYIHVFAFIWIWYLIKNASESSAQITSTEVKPEICLNNCILSISEQAVWFQQNS